MNNNLLFNISNNHTKYVNELKYQVRNEPRKYALQTARKVESIFIQMLLKSMNNSYLQNNLLDSNQSLLYTDIYNEALSEEMSKKGIGLTNVILQQIQSKQIIT